MLHIQKKSSETPLLAHWGLLFLWMTYDHKKIIILVEDHPKTIPTQISLNCPSDFREED